LYDMAGLVPKFSKKDIEADIKSREDRIEQALLARLQFVGEKFIVEARSTNTYKDRTGNLRNSIGYIILKNGEQLFDNFTRSASIEAVNPKTGKTKITKGSTDGVTTGHRIAAEIGKRYPSGFVLIVVAGMDYAAAVESKGFDVLTGSSVIAQTNLEKGLKELIKKIGLMK
jgi:hypothetical protein